MTFESIMKTREPADERTAVFKEFVVIAEKAIDEDNLSTNDRIKYHELYSEIHSALYYMQLRLTNAEEWLVELEKVKGSERTLEDQETIDKLRNIRDALPWQQGRWSGEKND